MELEILRLKFQNLNKCPVVLNLPLANPLIFVEKMGLFCGLSLGVDRFYA